MTKEQTNWEKEFDRQFSYLPPKDNKPPIFMAKGDIKYNLADLQSGSILLPVGATIEKVDNTDVREELKNFISKLISQEKEKWEQEIVDSLPENILAEDVLYISPERNVLTKEEYNNFMEHYNSVKGYETSVQVYWEYKRN